MLKLVMKVFHNSSIYSSSAVNSDFKNLAISIFVISETISVIFLFFRNFIISGSFSSYCISKPAMNYVGIEIYSHRHIMQSPGFEPGSRAWKALVLTDFRSFSRVFLPKKKPLDYDCVIFLLCSILYIFDEFLIK